MLIGYTRVSKADGSQSLDLQRDALIAAGVDPHNVYDDFASGVRDDRPGLENCLRALRKGDVLVVWKLDRLGRNLTHLVNTVQNLAARGVGLRVLTGQGAQIDTTTAAGRLVFGIFAALAEFEGELIRERTVAGLKAARARGRKGGGSSRCRKLRSVWHRPPWRTATRRCRNCARSWASSPSPSTGTSTRRASCVSRAGRCSRPAERRCPPLVNGLYGGMNRSLGRNIGFQATVRAGKTLNVVFRPLPQTTR